MSLDGATVGRPRYERLLAAYRDSEQVKVLQGVRRCGKSTILALHAKALAKSGVPARNIFYKRLDALEVPLAYGAEDLLQELVLARQASQSDLPLYVFLDEVQEVDGWERVVRRLHTQRGVDVYLTGSNAHVLSSDLATLLSGRAVTVDVFPLSFVEYLDFLEAEGAPQSSDDERFAAFLRYGGMPSLFSLSARREDFVRRELSAIHDTVLLNDVAKRLGARDIALLERLVAYLFSTSGGLFSTRKVVGALVSAGRKTSPETVEAYIRALAEAFLLVEVPQVGLAGKRVLAPQRKFYAIDTGLRNLVTRFSTSNLGFQLESVVCVELLRRGFAVEVGSTAGAEVDFVATRHDERLYIQVTQTLLDDGVYERELAPLRRVRDSFPKLVLSLERFRTGTTGDGIRIVSLVDWLRGLEGTAG